jgi:hypothetical protein
LVLRHHVRHADPREQVARLRPQLPRPAQVATLPPGQPLTRRAPRCRAAAKRPADFVRCGEQRATRKCASTAPAGATTTCPWATCVPASALERHSCLPTGRVQVTARP